MNNNNLSFFEKNLHKLDEDSWVEALSGLLPLIHEVDRIPTQIWFHFYPVSLFRYLQKSEDIEATLHGFAMQGDYSLADQIDSSHSFLYGHRFWNDIKHVIVKRAASFEGADFDFDAEVKALAKSVANTLNQEESVLTGITIVGLMTLVQVGLDDFKNAKGETAKPSGLFKKSADAIVKQRQKEDKQGLFGFLKTVDKEFRVTWDESKANAKFKVIYDEEIATAAARDQSQNWLEKDERCGEGVIPVECRAAACGTCWVGVIAGAEKLSDVQTMERKQMKIFGYKQGDEAKPFMRLACQATAEGSVSVVIPPWNGVFGKKVYGGIKKITLEPATTSAAKLREVIDEAASSDKD